jgi:hypothetical protein
MSGSAGRFDGVPAPGKPVHALPTSSNRISAALYINRFLALTRTNRLMECRKPTVTMDGFG